MGLPHPTAIPTVDEALAEFGGDHRKAEVAAWAMHERVSPQNAEGMRPPSGFSYLAIAIADHYHGRKDEQH